MKSFMINQQTCLKVTITKLLDKDGILVQPQIMKETQQGYPLSLFIPGSSHLALCPWKGGDNRFVRFSEPIYNKLKCIAPIWLSVSPTHLFSLFDFFTFIYHVCMCLCTLCSVCRGQMTLEVVQHQTSNMLVPERKLRWPGLVTSAFICWTLSPQILLSILLHTYSSLCPVTLGYHW